MKRIINNHSRSKKQSLESKGLIDAKKYSHENPKYIAYITSTEWQLKKEEAYSYHGKVCLACFDSENSIDIHHKTYSRFEKEDMTDLIPLCRSCHAKVHDIHRSATLNPLNKNIWHITEEFILTKKLTLVLEESEMEHLKTAIPSVYALGYRQKIEDILHNLRTSKKERSTCFPDKDTKDIITVEDIDSYVDSLSLSKIHQNHLREISSRYNTLTQESTYKTRAKQPDTITGEIWTWSAPYMIPILTEKAKEQIWAYKNDFNRRKTQ
jgi:hypothetical protein